jgi:hypothetical protein
MTSGPALPCPKCRKVLESISWHNADRGRCWHCRAEYDFLAFPALTQTRRAITPAALLEAERAACFYHQTNQADSVCEGCGRFVCLVCSVDFGGRKICPPCIETAKVDDVQAISRRTLFDGLALAVALLPLLMWPLTMVTAPVALGLVVVGWRKPRSLVGRGGRIKLICAALLALLQITGWIAVLFFLATKTAK